MEDMAKAQSAGIQAAEQSIAAHGDERALIAPTKVISYTIEQGDTLASIAKAKMGSESDADILAFYNRTVGLLFEDLRLYAGAPLEIPIYENPAAPAQPEQKPQHQAAGTRSVDGG
jgi:hypothetical protein